MAHVKTPDEERRVALQVLEQALQEGLVVLEVADTKGTHEWKGGVPEALHYVDAQWQKAGNPAHMRYDWWLRNTEKGRLRGEAVQTRGQSEPAALGAERAPGPLRVWVVGDLYEA